VALESPPATVIVGGTVATAVSELARKTTSPPASAAFERVTVPVEPAPPATVEGESESPVGVGGGGAALPSTVIVAVREMPLAEAVMVVVRFVSAARVEMGNVALLRWTVTVAGTVAAAVFELESETTRPPAGAPTESHTVPVALAPPWTDCGTETDAGPMGAAGGVTVSVALRLAPPKLPVMVSEVCAVTDDVATVNVLLVAPAAMVIVPGTVAVFGLLLASVTTAPPDGAAPVSIAVPCTVLPPTTLVGLSVIVESVVAALCGVKRRVDENGPNTPAELRARTRHQRRCPPVRPPMVTCETLTTWFALKGAAMVEELST
jgi:hypothetical protein